MLLSRIFGKRRYELSGHFIIHCLPPSQGYIVNVKLFPVAGTASAPPFGGEPPAEAYEGSEEIDKDVHIGQTRERPSLEIPFKLKADAGYYYLGVSVILFRDGLDGLLGQLERFCFGSALLDLSSKHLDAGEFPIPWPDTKIEDMHRYATFRPGEPPEFHEPDGRK